MDKKPTFITEFDGVPGFWNFLVGLDRDDLVAELVQNDLDQQATRTVISFEQDRLVCEGNGKPVDREGWQRLRIIQGAGDKVPAKRGKIGVKNHGLKTAFTVGDQIELLSDGLAITQTLYANGRNAPPHPGASSTPLSHPDAPAQGCRIITTYRTEDLSPTQGEAVRLRAVTTEAIDNLFKAACTAIPEQFAGIVSPEVAPQYEIVLRHWKLGEAHFSFSCTRPRKVSRNVEVYRRRCKVSGSVASLPPDLLEEAARQLLPLTGTLKQRTPAFFRREDHYFIEISWPINRRGKPLKGTGRFRYPIGYPLSSGKATTGHGFFFNAPFASDTERHGPAQNEATTAELRGACEALLVEVMKRHLVPKWKARGLDPLVPTPGADKDKAVRPILAELATYDAVPTLSWQKATSALIKGKKRSRKDYSVPRKWKSPKAPNYSFVLPTVTWKRNAVHPSLAILCPSEEKQVDPAIDPVLIQLLADCNTDGFGEIFITFDENDALARAKGEENKYFDAYANRKEEFAKPLIIWAHLDLIQDCLAQSKLGKDKEDDLLTAFLLPDAQGKVVPFRDLHSSAPLPSDIPGLHLPPLLPQHFASHPLLRRKKWRRPPYTLETFLQSGTLQNADEADRAKFWEWLRRNEKHIKPSARTELAATAIWPDSEGELCRLTELCEPRSKAIASILEPSIRRPHKQVRSLKITKLGGKSATSIRQVPTHRALQDWIEHRVESFEIGSRADANTAAAVDRFESDVARLMKNDSIARRLRETEMVLPALAQDQSIQIRTELVMPSKGVKRLELPSRFLLKTDRYAKAINKLSPAATEPTPAILLAAFEEDNTNFRALQPRLRTFLELTTDGDEHRRRVAKMPILPLNGQPQAPEELAFIGNKGDYWGDWKRAIPKKGLSQDEQKRYRHIGVLSEIPTQKTSLSFFRWLSGQGEPVLEQHIKHVLRHIHHQYGPMTWALIHTQVPSIPVRSKGGVGLLSLKEAQCKPVYLPDMDELAEQILETDEKVSLIIDHVKGMRKPITQELRSMSIKSLREAVGDPARVEGHGDIRDAPQLLQDKLRELQSSHLQKSLYKRLGKLGVELELIRNDWYHRVSDIKAIKRCREVEAIYKFRRRSYPVSTDAGFDPASGTFWIREGQRNIQNSFFEAIAAQLVFKPAARLVDLLALDRALDLEISDPTYGKVRFEEEDIDGWGNDGGQGESPPGHTPFTPDPKKNVPHPKPFASTSSSGRQRPKPTKRPKKAPPTPVEEKEHIKKLKQEHYASHCQMCLCEHAPAELAPVGSYVEWEEVRRKVIEAHHVDPKSSGGARHAGNLLLLCPLHHNNFGRRLTRKSVLAAIRGSVKKKSIKFDGETEQIQLHGLIATASILDTGESVSLFFTKEHIDYWLAQANTS